MEAGRNYTNTAMEMVETCLPHALQLYHHNSPQMDNSGLEKEGTTNRDMVAHREEKPQCQGLSFDMAPGQLQTEPDGELLLSPHVPNGAERMKE